MVKDQYTRLFLVSLLFFSQSACSKTSGDSTAPGNSGNSGSTGGGGCTALMGGATSCQLTLGGVVTTIAGNGAGNADGTGTAATFNTPYALATDGTNIYVADYLNHRIRQIVIATGVVTTFAGSTQGTTDGTGTGAQFNGPNGITSDGTNLFVTDFTSHRIRKIVIASGVVTTLAGSTNGSADGTGTGASFSNPTGITTDGTNVYVSDQTNHRIRKIVISSGVVTTLAGAGAGNADGTGTAATFNNPSGITNDGTNLYVADRVNHRIRKIVIASGVVTTLAGSTGGTAIDDIGTNARFSSPYGIAADGTNLYVTDSSNNRIRKIVISTAAVTTLAGNLSGTADGTGTAASFNAPYGVVATTTNIFVNDAGSHRIRKIQ